VSPIGRLICAVIVALGVSLGFVAAIAVITTNPAAVSGASA